MTRMLHGDTRVSKASPLRHLKSFLDTCSPDCKDKWVVMDEGGELCNNPEVRSLFTSYNYQIYLQGLITHLKTDQLSALTKLSPEGLKAC